MLHSRSRRRRASSREEFEPENGHVPTLLEIFLSYLTERVARSAIFRVRQGAREVVTWTLRQAMAGGVTAAVLTLGIALLLVAGIKGLEAAHCPSWVAYLSAGAVAIAGSLALMRSVLDPPENDDEE